MTPTLKYALGRVGIFVLCAVPTLLLFPADMNLLLKLLIALAVSAIASFFLLRRWRDEVAEHMSSTSRRRVEARERLRSALAGDDDPSTKPAPSDEDRSE